MPSSGNFSTWNPLRYSSISGITYSEGNCKVQTTTGYPVCMNNFAPRSGKWYVEFYNHSNAGYNVLGIVQQESIDEGDYGNWLPNGVANKQFLYYSHNGNKATSGSSVSYGSSWGSGNQIIGCALDMDNGKVWWSLNGTFQASGDPANGTNAAFDNLDTSSGFYMAFSDYNSGANGTMGINCGQDSTFGGAIAVGGNADENGFGDFKYSPPAGFLAMCSANLPMNTNQDPAQGTPPNNYFDAITYTGNGGTLAISSLSFSPNMVWIKNRTSGDDWCVQDTINGVGKTKAMNSASGYATETDCITSFDSNGFTMSNDHKVNASSENYVAYCFKESQEAGFDMFAYTGTGGGTQVVSHNLGETPKMVWIFLVSGSATDTMVYIDTVNMGTSYGIFPSLTNARQATSYVAATSSSNITVGSSANATGRGYLAMCWAQREGFSNYGQWIGNGDGNGPFIYTGFRPKFVWWKNINASENWQVRDTARIIGNTGSQGRFYFNSSAAEGSASTASPIDFLSNGFKIRGTNSEQNNNGHGYIYGAWADVPAKYNNAF